MTLGHIRINNVKYGGRWRVRFHRLELTSDYSWKTTFSPLKFPSGVYQQICSLGHTALIFAVEEAPAFVVGSGKARALFVRSGWPPEMPSRRPLKKSLCIFAAISRSPVAARPQRIIFSRYQVKTSLMSVPKTRPWRGKQGQQRLGSSSSRWQSTCSPRTQIWFFHLFRSTAY